jgi:hypothetical protein
MESGLSGLLTQLPKMECAHVTRKKLILCVLENAYQCYHWWKSGFGHRWPESPADGVLKVMEEGIQDAREPINLLLMLSCMGDRCISCQKEMKSKLVESIPTSDPDGELIFSQTMTHLGLPSSQSQKTMRKVVSLEIFPKILPAESDWETSHTLQNTRLSKAAEIVCH